MRRLNPYKSHSRGATVDLHNLLQQKLWLISRLSNPMMIRRKEIQTVFLKVRNKYKSTKILFVNHNSILFYSFYYKVISQLILFGHGECNWRHRLCSELAEFSSFLQHLKMLNIKHKNYHRFFKILTFPWSVVWECI